MTLYEHYSWMEVHQNVCDSQIAWFCRHRDTSDIPLGYGNGGLVAYKYDNTRVTRLPNHDTPNAYSDYNAPNREILLAFIHTFVKGQ